MKRILIALIVTACSVQQTPDLFTPSSHDKVVIEKLPGNRVRVIKSNHKMADTLHWFKRWQACETVRCDTDTVNVGGWMFENPEFRE